jgi:hypothetical protein
VASGLPALSHPVHCRGCPAGALALLLAVGWRAVNALSISARSYPEVGGAAWSLALLDHSPSVHVRIAHEPDIRDFSLPEYLAYLRRLERADERTRTADLTLLRVGRHRVHILLLPIQQKPTDNMVESISLIVEGTFFDRRHSRHHRLENLRKQPS